MNSMLVYRFYVEGKWCDRGKEMEGLRAGAGGALSALVPERWSAGADRHQQWDGAHLHGRRPGGLRKQGDAAFHYAEPSDGERLHGKLPRQVPREVPEPARFLTLDDARDTHENWRIDYTQVRPHSALGHPSREEFAMSYANVESTTSFPHSRRPDGGCRAIPPLNSNPSTLTYAD